MKPVSNHAKHRKTYATKWLAPAIMVFALLLSILTCQGQPQAKIDSLNKVLLSAKQDTSKVSCLLLISNEYLNANDYPSAFKYADSALSLASGKNFKQQSAKAYHTIGTIQHYQGNYQEALNNYLFSVEINEEIGDKIAAANSHSNISAIYDVWGDSAQSLHHFMTALNIMEETGDKPGMAKITLHMGMKKYKRGHLSEALIYFQDALKLYEEIPEKSGMAQAMINISDIHNRQGNYPKALESGFASLEINQEINDKRGIAKSSNVIGIIYQRQGDYPAALKYQVSALEIFKEIGDRENLAKTYSFLGEIQYAQGNYPEVLEYTFAAINIAEEIGNKSLLASCFVTLGVIHEIQGDNPAALEYYASALVTVEELGDKKGMAVIYNNIGVIHDLEGNDPEALNNYLASLRIKEEIGDKAGMADAYINIGMIYEDMGNHDESLKYLLRSIKIKEDIGDQAGMAISLNNIGIIYKNKGNYDQARKYLNEGLALALKIGTRSEIEQIYKELYGLDSAEANYLKALEHYKLYILYKDSLNSNESQQQIARLKLQYETEKKDKEIELLNKDNEIKSLQLSKQKAIRHGMIAGIVLLFITGFLLFRSFRLRKKLEQQQAIISERKRISADLHDDVGSGLSRIMLLTELVKNEAKTPEMHKEAEKIATISKELSANISEIIWALNANNDYLESLVAYIRRYAAEFFDNSAVSLKIHSTGTLTGIPISGELRREVFYTVKEALHNIYKHSQATEAKLGFSVKNDILTITIHDNGVGMPEKETGRYGNGLTNMRQRMEAVKGSIQIENHQGTKITLEVPVR